MSHAGEAARGLIAEDEPLLAEALARELRALWPEMAPPEVVHDGVAAVERALASAPDVLFLDIKMPGLSGIEAAEAIADDWPDDRPPPLLVFVTAYDEFAVSAFERAAVDYVLKPVTAGRLAVTVARLRERLLERERAPQPEDRAALFAQVHSLSAPAPAREPIRVIRASVGNTVRMIPAAEIICLEAADKYVTVTTAGGEVLVRLSLRELSSRLEGVELVQVHRGTLVNADCMLSATRDEMGHLALRLRGLERSVAVSRAFAHRFRPM